MAEVLKRVGSGVRPHSRPISSSRRDSQSTPTNDPAAPVATPRPAHAQSPAKPPSRVSTVGLSLSLEPSTMEAIYRLRACDFREYDPRRPDPFKDLVIDAASDESEPEELPSQKDSEHESQISLARLKALSQDRLKPEGSAEELGPGRSPASARHSGTLPPIEDGPPRGAVTDRPAARPPPDFEMPALPLTARPIDEYPAQSTHPRIRALHSLEAQASTDSLASEPGEPGAVVGEMFPPGDDARATFFRIFQNRRREESVAQLPRNPTSRHTFLRATDANFLLPIPSVVTHTDAEGGDRIKLNHFGLGSRYGVAVADSIKVHPTAAVVQMRANRLTAGPAIAIAHTIRVNPQITSLDLSLNRIGREGGIAVADCLRNSASLTHLDLGGNKLGDSACKEICQAVIANETLRTLSLADNDMAQLGAGELAKVLMANKTLVELDISWNHLRGSRALLMGRALSHNGTLTTLRMAWNGLGEDGGIEIAQGLRQNKGLTFVDLSANGLTERPCIVLGAALSENSVLQEVRLGMNPVGQKGGRALVRAMSAAWRRRTEDEADADEEVGEELPDEAAATRKIDLTRCNFECSTETGTNRYFDFSEPSGVYKLDVVKPYDRVVGMELMKLALDEGPECWKNARFNGRPFPLPERHSLAYALPDSGLLEVEYVHVRLQAGNLGYLNKKAFAMFTLSVQGDAKGLAALTKIASHDVYFTTDQIAGVLQRIGDSTLRVQAMAHVFSHILDFENLHTLVADMPEHEARSVRALIGQLYYFNPRNPTGHYKLSLENPFDRRIAIQLQEQGNKEKLARKNFADTSKDGRRENWRNEQLNGYPFQYKPSWEIPQNGVLEVDYTSTVPPPDEARPLAEAALEAMLEQELRLGRGAAAALLGIYPIDEATSPGPLNAAPSNRTKGAPELGVVEEAASRLQRRSASTVGAPKIRSGSMAPSGGKLPAPRSGSLAVSPKADPDSPGPSRRPSVIQSSTMVTSVSATTPRPPPPGRSASLALRGGSFRRSLSRSGSMRRRETIEPFSRLKILRLRTVTDFFSCAQIRRVAETFPDQQHRVDALATLFGRCTDLEWFWNSVVQACLDKEHQKRCMQRLGWLNVWNPVFAEGFYDLDLAVREERLVCECLVALAVAEPGENWIGETLNGTEFELPASWVKQVPTKGLVTTTYRVSESQVQIEARYAWVAKTLLGSIDRVSLEALAARRKELHAAATANSRKGSKEGLSVEVGSSPQELEAS